MSENNNTTPATNSAPHLKPNEIMKFDCEYTFMESLGYLIIWAIISILTLGIGTFFAIYYFYKNIINKSFALDSNGNKVGRLYCRIEFSEMLGHIAIWILITILTFGIGFLFYIFRTLRLCINRTVVVPL